MTDATGATAPKKHDSGHTKAIATIQLAKGDPLSAEQLLTYPPFTDIPAATLEKYPGAVVLRKFKKGEIICREGEYGSTAFYLLQGKVEVFLATPLAQIKSHKNEKMFARGLGRWIRKFSSMLVGEKRNPLERGQTKRMIPIDAPVDLDMEHPIAQMGPGDLFGEMTCLNFYPRSATVRALEDCEMLEMLRNILTLLQKKSKVFKEKLDSSYRTRAVRTHLRSVEFLEELDDEQIEKLSQRVELVTVEPGQAIFKQGDAADAAYLVRLGFVKISQGYPGGELVLRYAGRGDYFGAAGILGSGIRSATCSAVDHVELVKVRKDDITALMDTSVRVRKAMEKDVQRVQASSNPAEVSAPLLPLNDMLERGLMQAQNLLLLDLESCTRCDDCVKACADSHDGITRLVREGIRFDKYLIATSCRSCADPLCLIGCPVGSIHRKESLEIVIEDWCIGCGLCAKQCPYGNINLHPIQTTEEDPESPGRQKAVMKSKAVTCDLCSGLGEPSCVYACPHGAAMRVDPKTFFTSRGGGAS
ncbi:MAG TPA: cyclic nucleotide-binding domain-containing protein [Planctomycetota bacterium]|nr:cyclic nucleotide-binding domain-containing protein [Planctomycetota bacterium]